MWNLKHARLPRCASSSYDSRANKPNHQSTTSSTTQPAHVEPEARAAPSLRVLDVRLQGGEPAADGGVHLAALPGEARPSQGAGPGWGVCRVVWGGGERGRGQWQAASTLRGAPPSASCRRVGRQDAGGIMGGGGQGMWICTHGRRARSPTQMEACPCMRRRARRTVAAACEHFTRGHYTSSEATRSNAADATATRKPAQPCMHWSCARMRHGKRGGAPVAARSRILCSASSSAAIPRHGVLPLACRVGVCVAAGGGKGG